MLVGSMTKQPSESATRAIDFARLLSPGELIVSQVVTAKDLANGSDVTSTLIASPGHTPTTVTARVQAGTDEHAYRVQMRATTNGGNVYECEFDVYVREV